MLLVLVYLAALSPLAAAVNFGTTAELDFSDCPVAHYGQVYTTVYVNIISTTAAVCFKGPYPATADNDCVLMTGKTVVRGSNIIGQSVSDTGSSWHNSLQGLTGSSTCYANMAFFNGQNLYEFAIQFRQFGTQSALYIGVYTTGDLSVDVMVGGVSVDTYGVSSNIFKFSIACIKSGVYYGVNELVCNPDGSSVSCSAEGNLTFSPCGVLCPCPTCTVIGSTVVNFLNYVVSVPDRCAYTLLSESGVELLAVFRDRRRKDFSLLDKVILRLDGPGVNITLGPGLRLQVDDAPLSLGSLPLSLHGVDVSKNQTGVTATFLLSNYTTSVFFDGSTAQIHKTGSSNDTIPGLCYSSGGSSDEVLPEFSSSSCEEQFPEPADGTINCTTVTERCELLYEAPFTSCHNLTDPDSFIGACINTLCTYPAVDGLSHCQFLEAYVKACDFQTGDSLEGWRSEVGCSPPRASCQDVLCSDHEFCVEDVSGGTICACRAIFASEYRSTGALGEPTVCDGSSASVTLVGCLLEEKGIDYSELHLNNQSCRGQKDNVSHMVTFGFDVNNTCGMEVEHNNSQMIYKNSIMMSNSSDIITRHDIFNLDFSCFYQQPDIKTMSFRIKDSSVIQQIVSGPWNYTLTMKTFSDAGRTRAIEPSTELRLKQSVWVELKTDGLDDKLVAVVTDSCWATDLPLANSSLRYDLIVSGCSNTADQTVKVMGNGLGTSNYFSFNMFEFSGKSDVVYLHCKLNLCAKKGNTCAPSCGGKRRRRSARSQYEDGSSAFITMAWTN
ncbi:alpha-tectorin-like [Scophthalmus maximus]|uniref:alpha-tectorin-like n=1 Tax=Scophthalmus maximus TaxID=52904 RepID=UPI001FA82509|nr:alpha-tectorin-like [Scophthalmus maximus]